MTNTRVVTRFFTFAAALAAAVGISAQAQPPNGGIGPPPIPPGSKCVITFDTGYPKKSAAGEIEAQGQFAIETGWELDRIEIVAFDFGNPPDAVGKEAAKNTLKAADIKTANKWGPTTLKGLTAGNSHRVQATIIVVQTSDKTKSDTYADIAPKTGYVVP